MRVHATLTQKNILLVSKNTDSKIPKIITKDAAAAAAAKSLQSCPTLWNPTDGSPPGSSVPGIL